MLEELLLYNMIVSVNVFSGFYLTVVSEIGYFAYTLLSDNTFLFYRSDLWSPPYPYTSKHVSW